MTAVQPRAMGTPVARLDGPAKVTGTAPYAFEYPVEHPLYLHPVQATIARGRVTAMDTPRRGARRRDRGAHRLRRPELADTSDGDLTDPAGRPRCTTAAS